MRLYDIAILASKMPSVGILIDRFELAAVSVGKIKSNAAASCRSFIGIASASVYILSVMYVPLICIS